MEKFSVNSAAAMSLCMALGESPKCEVGNALLYITLKTVLVSLSKAQTFEKQLQVAGSWRLYDWC